jgi:hypothetical protein
MDEYGARAKSKYHILFGKFEGMRPLEMPVYRWAIILKLTSDNF